MVSESKIFCDSTPVLVMDVSYVSFGWKEKMFSEKNVSWLCVSLQRDTLAMQNLGLVFGSDFQVPRVWCQDPSPSAVNDGKKLSLLHPTGLSFRLKKKKIASVGFRVYLPSQGAPPKILLGTSPTACSSLITTSLRPTWTAIWSGVQPAMSIAWRLGRDDYRNIHIPVDGSEIRWTHQLRLVGNIPLYIYSVWWPSQSGCWGFLPSTVWMHVSHTYKMLNGPIRTQKIATLPSLPPVAAGAPSSPVIQAVQVAIQKLCLVEKCQLACIAMSIHIFMISCMCTMYSCKRVYNIYIYIR